MTVDLTQMNLVVQIENYEFNDKEHLAYSWRIVRKRFLTTTAVTLVAATLILAFTQSANIETIVIFLVLAIATLGLVQYLTIQLHVKKNRIQLDGMVGLLAIYEEGIRTVIKGAESWVPWSTFIGYRTMPFGISIQLTPTQGFIVPKRLFPTDETWKKVLDIVAEHLLLIGSPARD